MEMTLMFEILIIMIVGFLCLYLVVDRICRCVETTTLTKAYGDNYETIKKDMDN